MYQVCSVTITHAHTHTHTKTIKGMFQNIKYGNHEYILLSQINAL